MLEYIGIFVFKAYNEIIYTTTTFFDLCLAHGQLFKNGRWTFQKDGVTAMKATEMHKDILSVNLNLATMKGSAAINQFKCLMGRILLLKTVRKYTSV
jgi:hypothetical protein